MGKIFDKIALFNLGASFRRETTGPIDESTILNEKNDLANKENFKTSAGKSNLYTGFMTVVMNGFKTATRKWIAKPFIFQGTNGAVNPKVSDWAGVVTDAELAEIKSKLEGDIKDVNNKVNTIKVGSDVQTLTALYALKHPEEPVGRAHFVTNQNKYYISIANDTYSFVKAYVTQGVPNDNILDAINSSTGELERKYLIYKDVHDTYTTLPSVAPWDSNVQIDVMVGGSVVQKTANIYLIKSIHPTTEEPIVGFFGIYDDDGTYKGRLLRVGPNWNQTNPSYFICDDSDSVETNHDDYIEVQIGGKVFEEGVDEDYMVGVTAYPLKKDIALTWTEWRVSTGIEWE